MKAQGATDDDAEAWLYAMDGMGKKEMQEDDDG